VDLIQNASALKVSTGFQPLSVSVTMTALSSNLR
jgi:hypothetical protein